MTIFESATTKDHGHSAASKQGVALPGHFYIDIGNVCNLRCPFCVTGSGQSTQPRGLMTLDTFKIILSKISHSAKLISLYNWGEATLNRDLFAIIKECHELGIRTHIDSNLSALRFDNHSAERLVNSGLSSLFISVDGATQSVYELYRVRGKIDLVWKNLKEIMDAKVRCRSDTPHLAWLYHVHRGNEHEMGIAAQMANDLGIPIAFKRMSVSIESWKSSFHYNDDMFIDDSGMVQELYNPPVDPNFDPGAFHPEVLHCCHQMFSGTMTIDWNGDAYPCTTVEGEAAKMGNLLDLSLEEIWWGPNFSASRQFLSGFGPIRSCGSVCERIECPMKNKHAVGVSEVGETCGDVNPLLPA